MGKQHIMFKDMPADSFLMDAGIACHWPHGRGCYFSADKGFIIWVGEEDHTRIMAMKKSVKINDVFDRLKAAIDVVEKLIPGGCAKSNDFGVITSCPTNMGTGMRASVHVQLPKLTKDGTDTKAKEICQPFGLGVRGLGGEHTPIGADGTVDISPKARFCISEAQIACALYKGVEKVWGAEQNAKTIYYYYDKTTRNTQYVLNKQKFLCFIFYLLFSSIFSIFYKIQTRYTIGFFPT